MDPVDIIYHKTFMGTPYYRQESNSEEAIKEPALPEGEDILGMIPAEVGPAYCNGLFFIERGLKKLPVQERKTKRMELERLVWEAIFK